jgi:hypothetical protein
MNYWRAERRPGRRFPAFISTLDAAPHAGRLEPGNEAPAFVAELRSIAEECRFSARFPGGAPRLARISAAPLFRCFPP